MTTAFKPAAAFDPAAPIEPAPRRYSGAAELCAAIRAAAALAPELAPTVEHPGRYGVEPARFYPFTRPAMIEPGACIVMVPRARGSVAVEIITDGPACKWPQLHEHPEAPGPFLPMPADARAVFHYAAPGGARGSLTVANTRPALLALADRVHAARSAFDGAVKRAPRPKAPSASAPHVTARAMLAAGDVAGALQVAEARGAVFFGFPSGGARPILYMAAETIETGGHAFTVARDVAGGRFRVLHARCALSVDSVRAGAPDDRGFTSAAAALDWVETSAAREEWREKLTRAATAARSYDQAAARAAFLASAAPEFAAAAAELAAETAPAAPAEPSAPIAAEAPAAPAAPIEPDPVNVADCLRRAVRAAVREAGGRDASGDPARCIPPWIRRAAEHSRKLAARIKAGAEPGGFAERDGARLLAQAAAHLAAAAQLDAIAAEREARDDATARALGAAIAQVSRELAAEIRTGKPAANDAGRPDPGPAAPGGALRPAAPQTAAERATLAALAGRSIPAEALQRAAADVARLSSDWPPCTDRAAAVAAGRAGRPEAAAPLALYMVRAAAAHGRPVQRDEARRALATLQAAAAEAGADAAGAELAALVRAAADGIARLSADAPPDAARSAAIERGRAGDPAAVPTLAAELQRAADRGAVGADAARECAGAMLAALGRHAAELQRAADAIGARGAATLAAAAAGAPISAAPPATHSEAAEPAADRPADPAHPPATHSQRDGAAPDPFETMTAAELRAYLDGCHAAGEFGADFERAARILNDRGDVAERRHSAPPWFDAARAAVYRVHCETAAAARSVGLLAPLGDTRPQWIDAPGCYLRARRSEEFQRADVRKLRRTLAELVRELRRADRFERKAERMTAPGAQRCERSNETRAEVAAELRAEAEHVREVARLAALRADRPEELRQAAADMERAADHARRLPAGWGFPGSAESAESRGAVFRAAAAVAEWEAAGREAATIAERAAELASAPAAPECGGSVAFTHAKDAERFALAGPEMSAERGHAWRCTFFDAAGPVSDCGARSLAEACELALSAGFVAAPPGYAFPDAPATHSQPAEPAPDRPALQGQAAEYFERARKRCADDPRPRLGLLIEAAELRQTAAGMRRNVADGAANADMRAAWSANAPAADAAAAELERMAAELPEPPAPVRELQPFDGYGGAWVAVARCLDEADEFRRHVLAAMREALAAGLFYNSETYPRAAAIIAERWGYPDAREIGSPAEGGVVHGFASHCYMARQALRAEETREANRAAAAKLHPGQKFGRLIVNGKTYTGAAIVGGIPHTGEGIELSAKCGGRGYSIKMTAAALVDAIERTEQRAADRAETRARRTGKPAPVRAASLAMEAAPATRSADDAGPWRISARTSEEYAPANRPVHVLFSPNRARALGQGGEDAGACVGFYMAAATYRALPLDALATPADFERFGVLQAAPGDFLWSAEERRAEAERNGHPLATHSEPIAAETKPGPVHVSQCLTWPATLAKAHHAAAGRPGPLLRIPDGDPRAAIPRHIAPAYPLR